MSRVLGGYLPSAKSFGNSRRRQAMNLGMSCECTRYVVNCATLPQPAPADFLDAFARGTEGGGGGWGVPDPFGGDDQAYEATYEVLEELVEAALDRLEPLLAP